MAPRAAEILSVGVVTPLGMDGPSAAAAIEAGISRTRESPFVNRRFDPQVMALVPDDALPPLVDALQTRADLTDAEKRLLRLAPLALLEALEPVPGPPPRLLLAVPEKPAAGSDPLGPSFIQDLATQSSVPFKVAAAKLFRQGGAGGLFALHAALEALAHDQELVLVGGVDSFLDLRRLATLDGEDRLLRAPVKDGFIPGEGAAAILLGRPGTGKRLGLRPLAGVLGVGLGAEPGHRYSPQPYRGEGLAQAFQALFDALPAGTPKVRGVYAGFNGENMPAKEWGVAALRSSERFEADLEIHHPADCTGDTGAASGAIMVALAALGIQRGKRRHPCLVWCTADREPRAAALLVALG